MSDDAASVPSQSSPSESVPVADTLNNILTQAQDAAPEADEVAVAAEKAAAEKTAAEEAKTKVEQDRFAAKFAALSRKEKQMRDRERALAAKEEAIKAAEAEKTKYSSEIENFKNRIRKDPIGVMSEYGLTAQQLAEIMLNDNKPTKDMELDDRDKAIQAKIDALEAKLAEKEAAEAQERETAALNAFKASIANFISENAATYELVQANDAIDLVYQVIEEHHAGTGEILDTKRAADAVEEHLLEEAKKLIERPKVKGLLQPAPKEPAAPKGEQKPVSKTLTNAVTSTPTQPSRQLSNEESKVEAAKLIKWVE